MVRVHWRREDALRGRFCFVTRCPGQPPTGASAFHGNLVPVTHGRPNLTLFTDPAARARRARRVDDEPPPSAARPGPVSEATYEVTRWGRLCPLPEGPLAYRDTPPGGDSAPASRPRDGVEGVARRWAERIDLIQSKRDDEHFMVETDELGRSRHPLRPRPERRRPPAAQGACVAVPLPDRRRACRQCRRRRASPASTPAACPGRHAVLEPVRRHQRPRPGDARRRSCRRAPEAYRARQLRAVTLADYVARAEELPQRRAPPTRATPGPEAGARCGSRSTRAGTTRSTTPTRRDEAADHLDAVRLIGEDLEIRPARYRAARHPHARLRRPALLARGSARRARGRVLRRLHAGRRGAASSIPTSGPSAEPLTPASSIGRALAVEGSTGCSLVGMRRLGPGPAATARSRSR